MFYVASTKRDSNKDQGTKGASVSNFLLTNWTRRTTVFAVVFAILFAAIYSTALVLYANSGKTATTAIPREVENGIEVQIDLVSVDPLRREVTMRVGVIPVGSLIKKNAEGEEDIGFARPVRITIWANAEGGPAATEVIEAGQAYLLTEFKVLVNGEPNNYPLDRYRFDDEVGPDGGQIPIPFLSAQYLDDSGKPIGGVSEIIDPENKNAIQIGVNEAPRSPTGWTESWGIYSSGSMLYMTAEIKRAGGTLAFVVVVLVMMTVLAIAALSVSIRVFRVPGSVEATMASWQAALLFALIPLRNFLPGAPPIGAWIDVLVFYWVEIALMMSMAIFTYSWLRDRKVPRK